MTNTVETVLGDAAQRLEEAGVENSRAEARLLLCHALEASPESLIAGSDRVLGRAERAAFRKLLTRRCRREPLSHIVGHREFWSLTFRITSDTLDPRPDSETLIDTLLESVPDRAASYKILDLGTGSGCLLLAALSELPSATGLGIDISAAAIKIASANAESLALATRARFDRADWGAERDDRFDIILANPPYVPSADIARLEPEVAKFEPRLALDGGPDGLDAYRSIFPRIAALLAPDGIALVEIGSDQALAVGALAVSAGFSHSRVKSDLAGRPRCVVVGFREG